MEVRPQLIIKTLQGLPDGQKFMEGDFTKHWVGCRGVQEKVEEPAGQIRPPPQEAGLKERGSRREKGPSILRFYVLAGTT